MDSTSEQLHTCPYCGRPLHWVSQRWFGRGTYECDACGDFPDLTIPPGPGGQHSLPPVGQPASTPRRHYDSRPQVLLVDDSPEYRDLYAILLEDTATVITASRGEDAIAIASRQPIDVIVLDVMMPGMDGWQTCEQLKANPATRTIPVIMLTSLDGLDVPETAARVGAAYVLIKPCSVERLSLAIRTAAQEVR